MGVASRLPFTGYTSQIRPVEDSSGIIVSFVGTGLAGNCQPWRERKVTMTKLNKLGAALDKDNWLWLESQNEDIAIAVAEEVSAGATPTAIGRYMLKSIGEDRRAFISRVVSAARYLEATKG